jgi:hypothetical protein
MEQIQKIENYILLEKLDNGELTCAIGVRRTLRSVQGG